MTLPKGWHSAALGDVCRVVSGGTPKTGVAAYWDGDIPWLTPKDMSLDRSQVLDGGQRAITPAGLAASSATLFPASSVIVSSRAPIGYVAIAGRDMAANQGCKIAVPPADVLDSRYLYWFLLQAKGDLQARASGTTFKEISAKEFARTVLRWPSLEEQRRMVDLVEDHLSRLDSASVLLDQGVRRSMSVERASLDVATGEADMVPLGDLVQRVEAGKSFGSAARKAEDGEWAIIKVSAMTWGRFKPEENKVVIDVGRVDSRYEIKPGDLLVSRANTSAYVGASVLVEETRPRLLLSDKSLRLVPRPDVEPAYLHAVLRAPRTRSQISDLATGTKDSMRNISQGALLKVLVPAADTERQRRVVEQVRAISLSTHRLRGQLVRARLRGEALRRSVLAAAFKGTLSSQVQGMADV